MSAAEGSPQRPSRGRDIYFELGRGEAREGRPLEALLSAYRIGARVAWRHAAAGARQRGPRGATPSPRWPRRVRLHRRAVRALGRGLRLRAVRGGGRGGRPAARPGAADGRAPAGRAGGGGGRGPRRGLAAARHARRAGVARRPRRAPGERAAVRLARRAACATTPCARSCPTPRRPGACASSRARSTARPPRWAPWCPGRRPGGAPLARRAALRPGRRGPAPGRRPGGHGPAPGRAGPAARPAAARGPGRVEPGPARRPHRRARARACSRRCAAGSTTRGACPTWRAPSTCIRRRSATGSTQLREAFGPALDDPDGRFELALAVRAPGAAEPRPGEPQETSRRRPVSTS